VALARRDMAGFGGYPGHNEAVKEEALDSLTYMAQDAEGVLMRFAFTLVLVATLAGAADKPPPHEPPPIAEQKTVALAPEDEATFTFLKSQLLDRAREYQSALRTIDAFGTQAREKLKLDTGWQLDIATGKFIPRPPQSGTGPGPVIPEQGAPLP
jgi:hypothetical protein